MPEHEHEFNDLKPILTSAQVLQFFDQLKDIKVSMDASKDGWDYYSVMALIGC